MADHFNDVADAYDEVIPFFSSFAAEVDQRIRWPGTPATVLDLGAGRGAMTARALDHRHRVIAVDAAPRMVELVQRDHPHVEAHVMSADSLDLPAESSHGAGTFAKRLPEDKRHRLHLEICELIARSGGWTVRRSAAVWQGTRT